MLCSKCNGRLRTTQTRQWEGQTWRSKRCPDCDSSFITLEVLRDRWPDDLWAEHGARRRAREAQRPARRRTPAAQRPPAPQHTGGLALASIWGSVVAKTQQSDQN